MDAVACETSSECGALKCIEGVCRDPYAVVSDEKPHRTPGNQAWFGSRTGYGLLIAVIDIAASAIEPALMFASSTSSGERETMFGIMCFAPVTLGGSTVHFAHGRVVPGIISLFAWASLAGTTFLVAGVMGYAIGPSFNNTAAWITGLSFGAAGAAGLTGLDVWMARSIVSRAHTPTAMSFAPSFVPTHGGATFGVLGRF